ncbi:MAG: hypothetical protein QOC80_1386 [Frankiaceae bacterium]|nr:hypothetical protein [Frankiaceae bacterium]
MARASAGPATASSTQWSPVTTITTTVIPRWTAASLRQHRRCVTVAVARSTHDAQATPDRGRGVGDTARSRDRSTATCRWARGLESAASAIGGAGEARTRDPGIMSPLL